MCGGGHFGDRSYLIRGTFGSPRCFFALTEKEQKFPGFECGGRRGFGSGGRLFCTECIGRGTAGEYPHDPVCGTFSVLLYMETERQGAVMELLKVERLFAGYGKQRIVEDVSFSVKTGEIVGIFGENGCGKTTLLRGVAGLGTRMSGKIYVKGQDVTELTTKARAGYLSMFSSEERIPEGLLTEEVLEMGWYSRLRFLQKPDAGMRAEKEQVIEEMELNSLLFQYYDRLSQGQRQRVLLGRMLLQNAPVFLMDEPDSSLDFKHKHRLFQKMRRMVQEREKAGVVILHDPSLALTYCDRVFLMHEGRIEDVICAKEEQEKGIADKIKKIIGDVGVTKQGTSVIIFK